jgi:hypothetical protein
MMLLGEPRSGNTAHLCIADPKPDRLQRALEPGKTVRLVLDGSVDELTLREGHADLRLDVSGVAVRPEGRKTISDLIAEKQKKAV